MSLQSSTLALLACLATTSIASAADQASGAVTVAKMGAISPTHAAAYIVRDQRNARTTQTEILLTDVVVPASEMQGALDPHMVAINLKAINDRNYVLLWLSADGRVSMNATFSKSMTQFMDDTTGGLKVEWTTKTPTRLEGRVFSSAPIKTMDGTTYTVDLKFGTDVPVPPTGQPLAAGGGDAGKALTALIAAAQKKQWAGIKAGSSPAALEMFDKSYNSESENASDALDLLKAWLPTTKMKITGGQLRGTSALLDVEGEIFPGQLGLTVVQMVKPGAVWQFERAARAGMVR